MKNWQEKWTFLRNGWEKLGEIGSIFPSSQATAKAMAHRLHETVAPRQILEVGAGTGSLTSAIAAGMGPGDHLDAFEINEEFAILLRERIAKEPHFAPVRTQITIYAQDVFNLPREAQYDVIVSSVPFTVFRPTLVEEFFQLYQKLVKPTGTLTYIEYMYGRYILSLTPNRRERERLREIGRITTHYLQNYRLSKQNVWRNIPPAFIHTLQFTPKEVL